jgi:glycosyltransferase involved in cell wall biosynthesis
MRVLNLLELKTSKLGGTEAYLAGFARAQRELGWTPIISPREVSPSVREVWQRAGALVRPFGQRSAIPTLLLSARPDVVVCNFFDLSSPVFALARACGAAVVVVDDHSGPLVPSARRRALTRLALAPASHVVGVSGYVTRRLEEGYGLPAARVRRVDNGVRASEPGARIARSDEPYVLGVGHLIGAKGFDTLIDALARCTLRMRLDLVGDGAAADELARRAARRGVELNMMGLRDDVPDLMARAPIVAVPSRWHEAFGMVTAEAMRAGAAIVATDTGATPELLDGGKAGLIVPVDDPAAMAEALDTLASFPSMRSHLGRAARERADTHYSLDRMVQRMIQIAAEAARLSAPAIATLGATP